MENAFTWIADFQTIPLENELAGTPGVGLGEILWVRERRQSDVRRTKVAVQQEIQLMDFPFRKNQAAEAWIRERCGGDAFPLVPELVVEKLV